MQVDQLGRKYDQLAGSYRPIRQEVTDQLCRKLPTNSRNYRPIAGSYRPISRKLRPIMQKLPTNYAGSYRPIKQEVIDQLGRKLSSN
ncbi:hypothetical protein JTE90_004940 [Oedothorax gibbosus]|uniref:Sperm-lysin n=1 Tax=Oedothorax gibbosus TaxID=931172 RepID=A0AAV6V9Y5_9ARAC|nr:hypothetical protein JTE90_004940 [Oedothorax gibbosus]